MGRSGTVYETIWGGALPTFQPGVNTPMYYCLRVKFLVAGRVAGLGMFRDYRDIGNNGGYMRRIGPGTVERWAAFTKRSAATSSPGEWNWAYFRPWLPIAANDIFQIGVMASQGYYCEMITPHSGDTDTTIGHFLLPADTGPAPNSAWTGIITFNPSSNLGAAKVSLDVRFLPN